MSELEGLLKFILAKKFTILVNEDFRLAVITSVIQCYSGSFMLHIFCFIIIHNCLYLNPYVLAVSLKPIFNQIEITNTMSTENYVLIFNEQL